MKEILSLLLWLLLAAATGYGQERDLIAQVHYAEAEMYYNYNSSSGFYTCIAKLDKAEKALGATNPKILALKTEAYAKLAMKEGIYSCLYLADSCLKAFVERYNPTQFSAARYEQIKNLGQELATYKELIGPQYAQFYTRNYTRVGDTYGLFDINKHKMKAPLLLFPARTPAGREDDFPIIADTLRSLFEYNHKNYFALPFKTGPEQGYLCWWFTADKTGAWYMAYKDINRQLKAEDEEQTRFFTSFNRDYVINPTGKMKRSVAWPELFVQRSALKLEPNTEYFIWFSSSKEYTLQETASVPVYYFLQVTDDPDKARENLLERGIKKKIIRTTSSNGY